MIYISCVIFLFKAFGCYTEDFTRPNNSSSDVCNGSSKDSESQWMSFLMEDNEGQ